ncbi:MAG: tetratricopeptide repeat protein [Anaerolineae bacterium]|nr:tetratricopeptide repeat protein [Anaerolineae bacterium]
MSLPPRSALPFVDRNEDQAVIIQHLANPDCRLLTLLGPGGIGKTRLAVHSARQLGGFPDGVFFVPLEALRNSNLVTSSIIDAVEIRLHGQEDPTAQLIDYLCDKSLLLILDGFEQVLEAAEAIDQIIQNCSTVKILVTSRERLNLIQEWVFEVQGLPLPDDKGLGLERSAAGQLFLQRAQQAQLSFTLTDAERPHIARICYLVGGMPLGIELAAAWVRTLPCREIAQEVERNLDFLNTSVRNVPERHRSLRAVFEYSWNALSEEERATFRRLAVFRGGFDRDAAATVVGASLSVLASLTDQSLLHMLPSGRYRRSPILWQFAYEKLVEEPEEQEEYHTRHCGYYALFLQRLESALKGPKQQGALAKIAVESENIRTAALWAMAAGCLTEIGQGLESLTLYFEMQGRFQEGVGFFQQGLIACEGEDATTAEERRILGGRILARQGMCYFHLGHLEKAKSVLQQALARLQPTDLRLETAYVLYYLGLVVSQMGEYALARQHLQGSLALAKRSNDRWAVARALMALADVTQTPEEAQVARQYLQESVTLFRELGDRRYIAASLSELGVVLAGQGDIAAGDALLEESFVLSCEDNNRQGMALAQSSLGYLDYLRQNYPAAQHHFEQALDLAREVGDHNETAKILDSLGDLALKAGDALTAERLFHASLKTAMEHQAVPLVLTGLIRLAYLEAQRGNKELALELLAVPLSHAATEKELRVVAQALQAQLQTELPAETVKLAQARGRSRSLVEVVEGLLALKFPASLAEIFKQQELTIKIDPKITQMKVAEVTNSVFFEQLRQQALLLNPTRKENQTV